MGLFGKKRLFRQSGSHSLIALFIMGMVLTGCGQNGKPDEPVDIMPIVTFQMCPSSEGVEDFLKLLGDESAEDDPERYYNVTPEDISEDYGFRIFKSDQTCSSLLLYENTLYSLGECFGGCGVTSFAVVDLNADGAFELYFTYSWGSGIHRSQAGYFDSASGKVTGFDFVSWLGELLLETDDEQNLCVYHADCDGKSFVDMELSAGEKAAYITAEEGEISLRSLAEE